MSTYDFDPTTNSNSFGLASNWFNESTGKFGEGIPGASDTAVFNNGPAGAVNSGVSGTGGVGTAVIESGLALEGLTLTANTIDFGAGTQEINIGKGSSLTVTSITTTSNTAWSISIENGSLTTNGAVAGSASDAIDIDAGTTWTPKGNVSGISVSTSGTIGGGVSMTNLAYFQAYGGNLALGDLSAAAYVIFSGISGPAVVANVETITVTGPNPILGEVPEVLVSQGASVSALSVIGPTTGSESPTGLLSVVNMNTTLKVSGAVAGFATVGVGPGALATLGQLSSQSVTVYGAGADLSVQGASTISSLNLYDDGVADFAAGVSGLSAISIGSGAELTIGDATSIDAKLTNDGTGVVNISGGGDYLQLVGGLAQALSLLGTAGKWDGVSGADATIRLTRAQASVFGSDDAIDFVGSGDAASLYDTNSDWDAVGGSDGTIYLTSAQASVSGGGDSVVFASGSGDATSLYATAGVWDGVTGSSGTIYLTSAQASVFGSADSLDFAGGSGNAASLYDTTGGWDFVTGSAGAIYLTSAQASISGGADAIYFVGGSGDAVSLYNTDQNWDSVTGSSGLVYLTSSQASIFGGLDTIDFAGGAGDAISIYATKGVWDTVNGSFGTVYLTSAQASVIGGGDAIYLSGAGAIASLASTGSHADAIGGSGAVIDLYGAQATLSGSGDTANFHQSDTLTLHVGANTLAFQRGIGGADIVAGFVSSDVIQMSQSDFASFAALEASGDLRQSGANAVIALGADSITLDNVTASSLTAAEFKFV